MIDGIGRGGAGRIELPRGETKQGAGSVARVGAAGNGRPEGPGSIASALVALGAPVDSDKVSAIRQAIADGRYSVDPELIAERMIAADLGR